MQRPSAHSSYAYQQTSQPPAPQRTLGITRPISLNPPTQEELRATDDLVRTLQEYGQYESEEEARLREIVLGKIDAIFKEFVRNVSIRNGLPEALANDVGGKIFTFGSYRLGVHGKGSDIDTLCVAPKHVKREDFLEHMYLALKSRPEVSEITAVPDAYVPIIKLVFSNIPVDLLFARLALPAVGEDLDLSQDTLLKNLDERCVRSLNGSRVTDDILRLVPNVHTFRTALRCIKLWAKQRAIYSNVMGFFGGVAWAIVIARVCQLYPNAAAAEVVCKFFQIMKIWEWPMPVILKTIEDGPLAVRVWNPKIYPQDKSHRMPVITPAYPSMCSTHNVTASTQTITTQEFDRASNITNLIMVGRDTWSSLFQKNDFFHRYKYYLQIIASSNSEEKQQKWSGWVESRIRQLVMKLELVDNLDMAHPYIKGFEKVVACRDEQERHDVAHGIMPARLCAQDPATTAAQTEPKGQNGTVDMTLDVPVQSVAESISTDKQQEQQETADALGEIAASDSPETETETNIWTITFYIGLAVKPRDPESNAPRKLDISWPTSEFTKLVKAWDDFDESSMGLVIQHIRNSALPLDVYDESELPQVIKKRSKTQRGRTSVGGENPSKKMRAGNPASNVAANDGDAQADASLLQESADPAQSLNADLNRETNGADSVDQQQQAPLVEQTSTSSVAGQAGSSQTIVFGSIEAPVHANATTPEPSAAHAQQPGNGATDSVASGQTSGTTSPDAGSNQPTAASSPSSSSSPAMSTRSYSEALAPKRFGNGGLSGMGIQAPGGSRRAPEIRFKLAGQQPPSAQNGPTS